MKRLLIALTLIVAGFAFGQEKEEPGHVHGADAAICDPSVF